MIQEQNKMIDLKQKVFALYWGQKSIMWRGELRDSTIIDYWITECVIDYDDEEYKSLSIEVTPLSQVTDEHAIEVAKILGMPNELKNGKALIENIEPGCSMAIDIHPLFYFSILDFLRSKGYALPAFGYTVEQLIEAGIFKLKTTE